MIINYVHANQWTWLTVKETNPSQCLIRARGDSFLALPAKLFSFGSPHSRACIASHLSTSRHACSLLALWICMMCPTLNNSSKRVKRIAPLIFEARRYPPPIACFIETECWLEVGWYNNWNCCWAFTPQQKIKNKIVVWTSFSIPQI